MQLSNFNLYACGGCICLWRNITWEGNIWGGTRCASKIKSSSFNLRLTPQVSPPYFYARSINNDVIGNYNLQHISIAWVMIQRLINARSLDTNEYREADCFPAIDIIRKHLNTHQSAGKMWKTFETTHARCIVANFPFAWNNLWRWWMIINDYHWHYVY